MWPFKKRQLVPQRKETALGEALQLRKGEDWEVQIDLSGTNVRIFLEDKEGVPDIAFAAYVAARRDEIVECARVARRAIREITEKHKFSELSRGPRSEISLGFSWDEETRGEVVFVDFADGQIVDYCVTD